MFLSTCTFHARSSQAGSKTGGYYGVPCNRIFTKVYHAYFPYASKQPHKIERPPRVASHKNLTFEHSLPQLTIQLWGRRAAPPPCRPARRATLVHSCHLWLWFVKKKQLPPGRSLARPVHPPPASRTPPATAAC